MNTERISIKTVDKRITDGDAELYTRKRVSDFFTDEKTLFIEMRNTIDNHGTEKKETFINKGLIVWVEPKELIETSIKKYQDLTNYKKITMKLSEGTILDGKINTEKASSISDLLYKEERHLPFVILRDVVDSHENTYHTLFINKEFIIEIEELSL